MASISPAMPRLIDGGPELGTTQIALSAAVEAEAGEAIAPGQQTKVLRVAANRPVQPVAAWGDELVVRIDTAPAPPATPTPEFAFWNPQTGEQRPGWRGDAGTQEILTDVGGDWASVVRTGFELPFAEWTLQLRNLATGEVRTLAEANPEVAKAEGLQPGPPLGFAPFASVHDEHVAWAQYHEDGGRVERQVVLYDIDTAAKRVVASVEAGSGHVDSPSLGGGRLAWMSTNTGDSQSEFVVREVGSGTERRYRVEGHPFLLALTADGRYLAWDDQMTAKYSYDLARQKLTRFAGDEGWGVFAGTTAAHIAWTPAAAFGGTGGYFDAAAGETRRIERRPGVTTNIATLLGDWFAWQESSGTQATYYFEPVAGGTEE